MELFAHHQMPKVINWSFSQGEKIFFFPDQHLGRWTLHRMNIDPKFINMGSFLPRGGLSRRKLLQQKLFCGKDIVLFIKCFKGTFKIFVQSIRMEKLFSIRNVTSMYVEILILLVY